MKLTQLFFPRALRLTKKSEFESVYASRQCRGTKYMMFHAKENGLSQSRIGISIPKRVGNAVVRNTLKRRLREAFRLVQHEIPQGYDLVVSIHKNVNPSRKSLEILMLSILQEYDQLCKNS